MGSIPPRVSKMDMLRAEFEAKHRGLALAPYGVVELTPRSIPMPPGGYPEPSPERPTGSGFIGQAGVLPSRTVGMSGERYRRLCYEAHVRFREGRKAPVPRTVRYPEGGSFADMLPMYVLIGVVSTVLAWLLGYWG